MSNLTIAGLAREAGVGVETVRYYQRRCLLEVPKRSLDARVRRYGIDDLRRLRFIRSAQAAGFTLDQIADLIRMDARLIDKLSKCGDFASRVMQVMLNRKTSDVFPSASIG